MSDFPKLIIEKILLYFKDGLKNKNDIENAISRKSANISNSYYSIYESHDKNNIIVWKQLLDFRCLNSHWLSVFNQLIPIIAFYNKRASEIVGVKRGEYLVCNIDNYHPNIDNLSIEVNDNNFIIKSKVLYYYRRISLIIKNVTVENLWLSPMFSRGRGNDFHMDITLSDSNQTAKLLDTTGILHQINTKILSKILPSKYVPGRYGVYNCIDPHKGENKLRLKSQNKYTFISSTGQVIEDLSSVIGKKGDIIINPSYCIVSGPCAAYVTYKLYQFKVVESNNSILSEYIV
jgi:hypothetical protein